MSSLTGNQRHSMNSASSPGGGLMLISLSLPVKR
jgi:hypothetical protein